MRAAFPTHGANYAKVLAHDLAEQGFTKQQIYQNDGLTEAMLEPERPAVEIDRIAAFFENAAQLSNDDLLGFTRGQNREMRRAGLIYFIGTSSPTVLDLLKNLERYRRIFSDAIEISCETLETDGVLTWHFRVPDYVRRRQFVEFAATGLINMLRKATNRELMPEQVTFRHARNENTAAFDEYFGCKVHFGDQENSYTFRAVDLDMPLATADSELYKVLKNCCEHALQIKARDTPTLIIEVERLISDRLTVGEATLEDVARALGMSPRTLSRRLARDGTTFFSILEDLRKSLAENYLHEKDLVLAEIAFLLGYSGLSSFSDAFKRWTGTTPGQYRNG
jgi:AraC-like DNA-binding protein